jgi:hypothetical protein
VAPAKALDALRSALESGLLPLLARHLALVDMLAADAMSSGAAGQVRSSHLRPALRVSQDGTVLLPAASHPQQTRRTQTSCCGGGHVQPCVMLEASGLLCTAEDCATQRERQTSCDHDLCHAA